MITQLNKYRQAIYALLLLIPTYWGMRAEFFLLFILVVLFGEKGIIKLKVNKFIQKPADRRFITVWIVGIIVAASLINRLLNGQEILCKTDYYAAFYLFPFLIITGLVIKDQRFFKFLVLFTVVECLVGIIEYSCGIRSFFSICADSNRITDYSLLYNSRVFGLSVNSSVFAYKVFLAFILVDYIWMKRTFIWITRIILTLGLLISFSRTVVIVLLFYWVAVLIITFIRQRKEALKSDSIKFALSILMIATVCAMPLKYQLSRGVRQAESVYKTVEVIKAEPKGCAVLHALPMRQGENDPEKIGWGDKLIRASVNIQSSGRKLIWLNYLNFIEDHLWFGNGSDKLMFRTWNEKTASYKLVHAHNSFLQIVANNGILISMLYLIFFVLYFKRSNWLALAAIVFYSMFNYGIFWGFSYMDLVFLILLGSQFKPAYDNQGKS